MIPKIIHYCWFGKNTMPELARKCVVSWRFFCPDYEIIEWNENNFDINSNIYVKEAYRAKKWAFVSDYVRLWALVEYGGIYMDTDCELIKPIDEFLELEAVSGFEDPTRVPTALMGSKKDFEFFKLLLNKYENRKFAIMPGFYDLTTNVRIITQECVKRGLKLVNEKQTISGLTLFPTEYFCPKDFKTGLIKITKNTYAIHYFTTSWKTRHQKFCEKILNIFPIRLLHFLSVIKRKLLKI
jgi:hypothetical protein